MIEHILFWFLAILLIMSAAGVILMTGTVNSVMCLLVAMLTLAGLYVLLGAPAVALFQIIIYVGAVLVLFLFVIMLLNLKEKSQILTLRPLMCGAGVCVLGLVGLTNWLFWHAAIKITVPHDSLAVTPTQNIQELAFDLFGRHLLVFELTSVLLLVATIGAILMTKK
jgi:NADH-quinone oxidoreductase subunit J